MLEVQSADAKLFQECMRAPGQPLIVRQGASRWPAARLWTFDFFTQHYGDAVLRLADCLVRPRHTVEVPLREYLEYVQAPEGTRLAALAAENRMAAPFYAYGCQPFHTYPELLEHFALPAWASDWCPLFDPEFRRAHFPFGAPWLLFSGLGARSLLHRDQAATIAWFAQLRGHKRFILHPLEEGPLVYGGRVDPSQPDLRRFPRYAEARPRTFTLEPGDLMFLPQDWYHYVRTESPSMTLSGNLVTQVNLGDYLSCVCGDELGRVLGNLKG